MGSLNTLLGADGSSIRIIVNAIDRFCGSEHGVLLATDVAARGLDIPGVCTVKPFQPVNLCRKAQATFGYWCMFKAIPALVGSKSHKDSATMVIIDSVISNGDGNGGFANGDVQDKKHRQAITAAGCSTYQYRSFTSSEKAMYGIFGFGKNNFIRNFSYWHCHQPQLVVTEAEFIKEIMNNKNGSYPKLEFRSYAKKLLGDEVSSTEGLNKLRCIFITRDQVMGKKVNKSNRYRKSLVKYDEFNDDGYKSEEDKGFNMLMVRGKGTIFLKKAEEVFNVR
ncbi:cytochrome P450 CYP749A22-like protein [Tanacetum coccineum]|uniref:Cytochrome P450 CYP749A22-like protein n=1 Tax=Tanacetum coccineum TaxID=301880 RepID=A0ABQ5J8K9_9ASTR